MNKFDAAIQIDWEKKYQSLLVKFLKSKSSFQGGEICRWMRVRGLGEPVHHNMWATQLNYYAGKGWFKKVGNEIPTTSHTHINSIAVWQSQMFSR